LLSPLQLDSLGAYVVYAVIPDIGSSSDAMLLLIVAPRGGAELQHFDCNFHCTYCTHSVSGVLPLATNDVFSRRILQLLITCITHDYTLLCTSLKLRIQNDVLLCLVRSQLTLLRGCLSGSPDRASDTHGQIALGIHQNVY
jgi:hypothetical protein